jgi:hypothetical protein
LSTFHTGSQIVLRDRPSFFESLIGLSTNSALEFVFVA